MEADWCDFCGDERPCECDEQLSDELFEADLEDDELPPLVPQAMPEPEEEEGE